MITLVDEEININEPLTIFHPLYTWKRKTINNFYVRPLLETIYENGKLVYERPSIEEIRDFHNNELNTLWEEHLRLDHPQIYKVDLSQRLWDLKNDLLNKTRNNIR